MVGYIAIDVSSGDQVLNEPVVAFWVGTMGDLAIEDDEGTQVVLKNIDDGTLVPVAARKVLNSGTTATDVIALTVRGLAD